VVKAHVRARTLEDKIGSKGDVVSIIFELINEKTKARKKIGKKLG
jgi:hypothetical protein